MINSKNSPSFLITQFRETLSPLRQAVTFLLQTTFRPNFHNVGIAHFYSHFSYIHFFVKTFKSADENKIFRWSKNFLAKIMISKITMKIKLRIRTIKYENNPAIINSSNSSDSVRVNFRE